MRNQRQSYIMPTGPTSINLKVSVTWPASLAHGSWKTHEEIQADLMTLVLQFHGSFFSGKVTTNYRLFTCFEINNHQHFQQVATVQRFFQVSSFLGKEPSNLSMRIWNLVPARKPLGRLCKTSGAISKGVKSVPLTWLSRKIYLFARLGYPRVYAPEN